MPQNLYIDPLSACSLRVTPFFQDTALADATGFIVAFGGSEYLITNYHVAAGRHPETGVCLDKKYAAVPNRIIVKFHKEGTLGEWIPVTIPLLDADQQPLWLQHPLGPHIDVVAIRLKLPSGVASYPLELTLANTDMAVMPGLAVSVIGFPLGLSSGENWPIWKTGHIASDPDIDFQKDRPAFLIDATTREGMSGAPVVMRGTGGGYRSSSANMVLSTGIVTKFLGVYSGRIHEESEIGRVWRPFLITEILARKLLFTDESGRVSPSRNSPCPCTSGARFKECCGQIVESGRVG